MAARQNTRIRLNLWWMGGSLMAVLASTQVAAQDSSTGCMRNDYEARTAPPSKAIALTRNAEASCWVDLRAAEQVAMTAPATIWIDVRPGLARERDGLLRGAVQLPPSGIARRAALKDTPLILVGSGPDEADMASLCRELQQAGFKTVHALAGGSRAWARAGKPMATSQRDIRRVLPEELLAGSASGYWSIVALDLSADEQSQLIAPPVLARQSAGLSPAELGRELSRLSAAMADRSTHHVHREFLLVSKDEDTAKKLVEALPAAPGWSASWLGGGSAASAQYVQQWRGMTANAEKSTKVPCNIQ